MLKMIPVTVYSITLFRIVSAWLDDPFTIRVDNFRVGTMIVCGGSSGSGPSGDHLQKALIHNALIIHHPGTGGGKRRVS